MADVFGTEEADLLDGNDGVTEFGDRIYGGGGADEIYGLGGRDLLVGGAGGDYLDGGDGVDIVICDTSPLAVFVSLATASGVGGDANGDIYVSIEDIIGSKGDDFLVGDDNPNFINGIEGNNTIQGKGGNDILNAYQGNDNLSGGEGNDRMFSSNGNDSLDGGNGDDDLASSVGEDILSGGEGDDILEGGEGADKLDGGNGNDTASYGFGAASGLVIDLILGTASDGDTLAGIENVDGGGFADIVSGSDEANKLRGGSGDDMLRGRGGADTLEGLTQNDIIVGGAGADALDGGEGTDRASYVGSTKAVTVNLELGTGLGGHADGDTFLDIEDIGGSSRDDLLTGSNSVANTLLGANGNDRLDGMGEADALSGGNGNDTLIGGDGADVLNGNAGADTADYSASSAGITINLASGLGSGGQAQGDVLKAIENVTGSVKADSLLGNALDNQLTGAGGADFLAGNDGGDVLIGGAGADQLYGGLGIDLASYAASAAAVKIDLGAATASGGDAAGDILAGIEMLTGSRFDDALTGDGKANTLSGGIGNDSLSAAAGNDQLAGGRGNDVLTGGNGNDRFRYASAQFGADTVKDFADGIDKIDLNGSGLTFASFTLTQAGKNAVLTLTADASETITLTGVNAGVIDAADFLT